MFLSIESWMDGWNIGYWNLLIFVVFLAVGTFALVKCCDVFVDSACSIAKKLHVSPLIIGLTIVAMGTSCPELAVSASDSISALVNSTKDNVVHANIAMGNMLSGVIRNQIGRLKILVEDPRIVHCFQAFNNGGDNESPEFLFGKTGTF